MAAALSPDFTGFVTESISNATTTQYADVNTGFVLNSAYMVFFMHCGFAMVSHLAPAHPSLFQGPLSLPPLPAVPLKTSVCQNMYHSSARVISKIMLLPRKYLIFCPNFCPADFHRVCACSLRQAHCHPHPD